MLNKLKVIIAILSISILFSCKQGDPPVVTAPVIPGDFEFSGYQWKYKDAPSPVGPGPNRFSGTEDFAWVDANGHLHLKIAKNGNFWTCSEIISTKVVGYGTYIMTCTSDISTFNEKAVFGFFTWDSYSFQSQANSEVDVEFSRWNNPNDTTLINYAVQPVIFSNPIPNAERSYKAVTPVSVLKEPITHMMRWTPDSVHYESYAGTTYPGPNKIAEWTFTKDNVARQKIEGPNTSDPIIIPAPSDSTNVRFNFWLLNGAAPTNNQEHEIIISSFSYEPL
jgi:hypothetical protein